MDKLSKNPSRRRALQIATSALGFIGGMAASVPFIRSMDLSARARSKGGPITIDIGRLAARQQISVLWRGKPIWVLHRDDAMLEELDRTGLIAHLRDPESSRKSQQPLYAANAYRSVRPDYFVAIGLCTHLGCVPSFRPDVESAGKENAWPGGYFCPCHGSKFDLAGRVYRDVPAPSNLIIPPHRYLADDVIEIGNDPPA